jgi:hypothetical protein
MFDAELNTAAGTAQPMPGIHVQELAPGAVIGVDTRSHHYRIEYLGGDDIRISGHPSFCPTPIPAQLRGSIGPGGELEVGYVGPGMRMAFRRINEQGGVVTSPVTGVWREPS